jgi:hypothetical protein
MWHLTDADETRSNQFQAIFTPYANDPASRIETVTIPRFARDTDPVFSRNPRQERYDDYDFDRYGEPVCAGAGLSTSVSVLLAAILATRVLQGLGR